MPKLSRLPRVETVCGLVPGNRKYLIALDLPVDRLRYGCAVANSTAAVPTVVNRLLAFMRFIAGVIVVAKVLGVPFLGIE